MTKTEVSSIFKKMSLKEINSAVLIGFPEEFQEMKKAFMEICSVHEDVQKSPDLYFAFAKKLTDVEAIAKTISKNIPGDQLVWIAYPKGSSKKYTCEFNRDNGWQSIGNAGFEGVRQISLNEDWSALRFRRAEFIKKMTRSFAMSEVGKKKASTKSS
jgi:hypothetical protein